MDIVEKLRRQSASDEAAGTLYSHTIAADAADEIERLRQDARRYRWLREQPNDTSAPRIDVVYWTVADESANYGEGLRMEALDAAIDAAMLKTPNLCRLCGHEIYSHDRQYGCAEDGCDCETPNASFSREPERSGGESAGSDS